MDALMTDNDHSNFPISEGGDAHRLEYELRKHLRPWRKWSKPGLISLAIIILWYPWQAACFLIIWIFGAFADPPTRPENILYRFLVLSPIVAAFAFGGYSLKTHGLSLHNLAGVIGFIVSATLIAGSIIGLCLK